MDKLELYEVIAGIDGEIVDSALEAERTQKRKRAVKRTRITTVALIASAFLVVAAAATAIYVNAKNAKNRLIINQDNMKKTNENETAVPDSGQYSRWGDVAISADKAKTIATGMTYSEVVSLMGPTITEGMTYGEVVSLMGPTTRYRSISSRVSLSPFSNLIYPCHYSYLLDDNGLMVLELRINNYSYDEFVSELGGWKYFSENKDRKPADCFTVSSISVLYGDEATAYLTGANRVESDTFVMSRPETWYAHAQEGGLPDERCESINAGMTFEQIVELIGRPQRNIGYRTTVAEWDLKSGKVLRVVLEPDIPEGGDYYSRLYCDWLAVSVAIAEAFE